MDKSKNILIFGVGAVGSTVAGWIGPEYPNCWLFDKEDKVEQLNQEGILVYLQGKKDDANVHRVKAVSNLASAPAPDVVIISVKNFSLDGVASFLKSTYGDTPIYVTLQNGVENQTIMPKYFSKVIYGVISYNAWMDSPVVTGYQKRGPIIIGTPDNSLQSELATVSEIFNLGVETIVTDHLRDAAHCKMVVNLTNSLTTLVGNGFRPISDYGIFQKLLTNLLFEGIRIIKFAGVRECQLGGMPSWLNVSAGANLPQFLTRRTFMENVGKMVMSSMAQDIIQRGSGNSELDTINGYFLTLADQYGMKVPYNRAIFDLCKNEFVKPAFEPVDVKDVWQVVRRQIAGDYVKA